MKIQYHLAKGFSLIELMITLVLSLLITYAIAQALISSNRSSVTSDGVSQSQETGRFIMSFLARQIRQSGLNSISNTIISSPTLISCTNLPDLADNNACIEQNGGGEDEESIKDAGIHGDRLAVAWIPPSEKLEDCTGSTGYLPTGAASGAAQTPYTDTDTIINTFWVEFNEDTELSNLMCQGFLLDGADIAGSSSAQSIANGVEAMQILYGEATNELPEDRQRNVNRYVPANDVANWERVYAVRISILTRSISDVTNEVKLRRYVLADAAPYEMNDAVSRQVFNSTFVINNYR